MLMIGRRGKREIAPGPSTWQRKPRPAFVRVDVPRMGARRDSRGSENRRTRSRLVCGARRDATGHNLLRRARVHSRSRNGASAARNFLRVRSWISFSSSLTRSLSIEGCLVIASTSHSGTLPEAFLSPGRFERIVEVNPLFPDDIEEGASDSCAGCGISCRTTHLRARLDWSAIVNNTREPSIGDWIRILHAVLRRKARLDAAGESPEQVTQSDFSAEISRFRQANTRIRTDGGNYL